MDKRAGTVDNSTMQQDIDRVLFDRQAIAQRVHQLARQITADLAAAERAAGQNGPFHLTLVPVLTGSVIFLADLIRQLPLRMQIRLISVSSYPGASTSSRGAMIEAGLTKLPADLSGHHVLVVDDILDSGKTLRLVRETILARKPAGLRTCVLLRKRRPEAMAFPVDYVCFDIPDEFVVGYGLDYDDYYRNLPEIVTLKPEVFGGG